MASPMSTRRPSVRIRLVALIPPAKVEVPVVVTSRVPPRVREVVLISVAVRAGKVEVPAEVMVNLPADWISPPEIVKPTAELRPPVVTTFTPPVKEEVADSVTSRAPAKELLVVEVALILGRVS